MLPVSSAKDAYVRIALVAFARISSSEWQLASGWCVSCR